MPLCTYLHGTFVGGARTKRLSHRKIRDVVLDTASDHSTWRRVESPSRRNVPIVRPRPKLTGSESRVSRAWGRGGQGE